MNLRLALSAAALMLCPAPGQAAQSYDNCTGFIASLPAVIATQGTWCMNKDLATAITQGNAITINTNNVILDCNDFKLGNLAAGPLTQAIGVYSENRFNHTVRNCNIRGFNSGVQLTASDFGLSGGHVVEDSRIELSRQVGIGVAAAGSQVRRNRVVDTGDGDPNTSAVAIGISAVLGVDVTDNLVDGVYFNTQAPNTLVAGIAMQYDSGRIHGNSIRDVYSNSEGATVSGIFISESGAVAITDNHVGGSFGGAGTGIRCVNSNGRARDNLIHGFGIGLSCADVGNNDVAPLVLP